MSDPTPRGNASKSKWANPEIRQRIIAGQRAYWQNPDGTPNLEIRKQRGKIAKDALASPQVRQRISDGTKEGLKPAEVRDKISKANKRTWDGNTERREQAKETAKRVFRDPEVEQRRREGFDLPETKNKIGQGLKRAYDEGRRSKEQVGKWATQLWAARKKRLAELEHLLAESTGIEDPRQLKKLALAKTVSTKLAEPATYMWMSPDEVAEALGVALRTFYRNVRLYLRLRRNQKGWYLTSSVIEQIKSGPSKK